MTENKGKGKSVYEKINEEFPRFCPSWDEFWDFIEIRYESVMSVMREPRAYRLFYLKYVVYRCGKKQFDICPDLYELLMHTDCSGFDPALIKMPFDGFTIVTKEIPGTIYCSYVYQEPGMADRIAISLIHNGMRSFCGGCIKQVSMSGPFWVSLSEIKKASKIGEVYILIDPEDADDQIRYESQFLLQAFFSFLFYVNSFQADIEIDPEADRLFRQLQGMPGGAKRDKIEARYKEAKRRHMVGGHIKIDKNEFRIKNELEKSEEGRKILARFQVRGHFRNQVCGPNRSDRRLTWIKPHWKGPTFAEIINREYMVS